MRLTLRHEAFITELAGGKSLTDAYIAAGFGSGTRESARVAATRLAKRQEIQDGVKRIRDERAAIADGSIQFAIEHSGINRERVAVELGRIGFANMMDYMRVGPSGDPVLDFSGLTREQAAALTEVTVDDYVDGRGENAREVRKVKFKLGDKRAALMDIAKLFGWIIEKRENKIVNEFDSMSAEEISAWLDEQAAARLQVRHRQSAEVRRRSQRGRVPVEYSWSSHSRRARYRSSNSAAAACSACVRGRLGGVSSPDMPPSEVASPLQNR